MPSTAAAKINANKAMRKGHNLSAFVSRRPHSRKDMKFQHALASAGAQHGPRLIVTEHPSKKFFTCTAKTNRLRVGVTLPDPSIAPASMAVDLILIYAKTQRIVEDQSILLTFTKLHSLEHGRGVFEFRIEEVSSRHNRQLFAIKVQPRDGRFKPAYTTGVDVKSKIPPKKRRGNASDYEDEHTGAVHLPSLMCGHTAGCSSCAQFLETTLMEVREMINTKLEDAILQIRRCAEMTDHDSEMDHFKPDFSPGQGPGRMPMAHIPMGVLPPPVLPPMVSQAHPRSMNGKYSLPPPLGMGGASLPGHTADMPRYSLRNNIALLPDIEPPLMSSDSAMSSCSSSPKRGRSLTPDDEINAFLFGQPKNYDASATTERILTN